ncbi:acetate--CoA ligase family protein [Natronosporangium hydrolyticum]|uniref:Acetate--CoA ligase family protein n=1 Tax=Natronosporangium hydrolyticum TaxID=2811111 RepID=A0A895YDL7_9ACTN|nr:acetate--CoA ligase [Natronosporangium hydrolyticum]QSB15651.1 acetate--CoA ligase family protein [Natronosporangium hydrolyticum]
MFDPHAIAVVGASNHHGKRGNHAVRQLLDDGYPHPVYPVHPREACVLGLPAYPTVSAIGAPVDLAFIATPARSLPAVLADCGAAGVAGAVAVAVGFAETGDEGARYQAEAVAAARDHGVRLLGPNTSGCFHLPARINLVGLPEVPTGPLGVISQSGNLLLSVIAAAHRLGGTGFSRYAGVGNEADLGFPELIDYLGDATDVGAVCGYAEGFRRGRETLAAITRTARRKPVVLLKGGQSDAGGRSARSHTGAVAGDATVATAALHAAGAEVVAREDELLPVSAALANWPAAGPRVAVLADGGGHATMTADAIAGTGRLRLAEPAEATRSRLRRLLGPAAAVHNPVDVAGATDTDPARFAEAAELLLADAEVDQVILVGLIGGYAQRFDPTLAAAEQRASQVLAERAVAGKPLLVCSVYPGERSPVLAPLAAAGVPVMSSVDVTVRCAAAIAARQQWLAAAAPQWPPLPSPAAPPDGLRPLTEPAVRELLAAAGVPIGPHRLARTPAEAAQAAGELAGPVALKVVSPDVVHKSDVGGVRLGVAPADAAVAYQELLAQVSRAVPTAALTGALLTPMVETPGVELLIGVAQDATFGPVLTVGAGGTLVELLRDVSVQPLPVTAPQARAMLDRLGVARLLRGYRGAPAADLSAVVALIVAVGEVVLAHPDVVELELNPVLAQPAGATILDARAFVVD